MTTKKAEKTAAQKARERRARADTADANRYFEAMAKRQAKRKGK